jgi:hypothetical protein
MPNTRANGIKGTRIILARITFFKPAYGFCFIFLLCLGSEKVSFSVKLAASAASGGARMKLHLDGTVNRLNVEHRTSNIECPILMTLRFIDFKTSEPQNFEG